MNYLKRIACICCQTRDGGEGTCLIIFYWFECISLDLRVFMYWGKDGKNLSLAYLIGNLSKLYNVIKNVCGNISVSFVRLSVSDFLFPIFWNYVYVQSIGGVKLSGSQAVSAFGYLYIQWKLIRYKQMNWLFVRNNVIMADLRWSYILTQPSFDC